MANGFRIEGTSGVTVNVNSSNQMMVVPETDAATNPGNVGGVRIFSENDTGSALGSDARLVSPETDLDFRLRVGLDLVSEDETFNSTAQNTGKYQYHNTTMTNTWATAGMQTNSGGITTTTTGTSFRSYAPFPTFGTCTTAADIELAFSAWLAQNTTIDFGLFINATSNPYAPTDGVYFRASSAGLTGVMNFNGSETSTGVMNFTPTLNKKYEFIIYVHHRYAQFWINDGSSTDLYGVIETPSGFGQPNASPMLPIAIRHAIVGGAASAAMSATLSNWNVRIGGFNIARTASVTGNALYGSYQGLTGNTLGSLANFANSANPTAAVPTNTTAALGTGLGGQFWETDTLAVTTDGVIDSFQVPAVGANASGRRLVIYGVKVDSFIQTALTGGGYNAVWSLAFGHTAVSLATAEAATTKAPRRIAMGAQSVASGAAALTQLSTVSISLSNPVYVNPGEFVAVVKKKVGTAPSAGVVAHYITFDYGWE